MMKRFLRLTRTSAQSGQAIVIVALTMSAMLVLAVLALDGGRFYTQRRTSQNASDIASLGAIHPFLQAGNRIGFSGTVLGKDITDDVVFNQIVQFAQANGIPDTNNNPSDAINDNVQAWWLDKDGKQIIDAGNPVEIVNDFSQFPPLGANGIEVRTRIPYQTFIGGLVHQESLTAQADGTARVVWSSKPITGITDQTVWIGSGSGCDNLTDRIAHNYSNTNSAKFNGSMYINGSLAVGAVNGTDFFGDVNVVGPMVGTGPKDGGATNPGDIPSKYALVSPISTNPFTIGPGSPNRFHGHSYNALVAPPSGDDMSPWAYISGKVYPGDGKIYPDGATFPDGTVVSAPRRLLEATDFLRPNGEMYRRYLYIYVPNGLATPPPHFYHYLPGGDNGNPGSAADWVNGLWNAHERGIFYIDGDMTITNASLDDWQGVTLIVSGRFASLNNNHQFYNAGPAGSYISVLAGYDFAATSGNPADRCASDRTKWVFKVDGNNNRFNGTVYVPHGQSLFVGNTGGGNISVNQIVTYSLYLGTGDSSCGNDSHQSCQAQSWWFYFDSSQMRDWFASTTLQQ